MQYLDLPNRTDHFQHTVESLSRAIGVPIFQIESSPSGNNYLTVVFKDDVELTDSFKALVAEELLKGVAENF